MSDPADTEGRATTPLDALDVMASSDVLLSPTLRHIEIYTRRGLLTLLWHSPAEGTEVQPGALVLCGGAMGGLLGPGDAMYHRLGEVWAARGVNVLRVSYRRPNDLDMCCLDAAAAAQLAIGGGHQFTVRNVLLVHASSPKSARCRRSRERANDCANDREAPPAVGGQARSLEVREAPPRPPPPPNSQKPLAAPAAGRRVARPSAFPRRLSLPCR